MNDLDQLKELLFGAERQALDSITQRVEQREVRAADVADILPEAIHQSHRKNSELVDSMTDPVGQCLQRALHDDPETYGNALYPVMGPAIRKSIMHALRNLAQQINQAVEHSVSPTGLKWRWQASRAGVPFGEYVLQKTMQYRVEQAYLISRENGLLVGHVHHEASRIKDSDAVSAMFTAIQDFVKESFSPDRSGRLESADMGDFTLWAVHGPHALLVCVIRGVPPKALRGDLSAILERIHFRYGDAIRDYRGDTSTVPDVDIELERCLRFEAIRQSRRRKTGTGMWLVALLLLVLVAFFGYRGWGFAQEQQRLEQALEAAPGVYVTEIDRDGNDFRVRGLRDPLAADMDSIAAAAGIDAGRVIAELQPFQSLQTEMVAARAKELLNPPPTVEILVDGATLVAQGDAPWTWRRDLQSRFATIPGIRSLEDSSLTSGDRDRFVAAVQELSGRQFLFTSGVSLSPDAEKNLEAYGADLQKLLAKAEAVGYSVGVSLHGSTDTSGSRDLNAALALRRAAVVAAQLANNGIAVAGIERGEIATNRLALPDDVSRRFVRIELALRPLQ